MSSEPPSIELREWTLEPETEYRFELDPGSSLAIKLLQGQAEVFGAELALGKHYLFGSECKASVFTWQGCTLEMSLPITLFIPHHPNHLTYRYTRPIYVSGHPSTEYVSEETPMAAYANVHMAFEQMRVRALAALHNSPISEDPGAEADPEAPRVLVLGPENSGKTSVCKILINYAVRAGQSWAPLLANVDPSEGGWSCPGAISAAPVTSPLPTCSPANPLGSAATSAPTALSSSALLPLAYWYGHTDMKRNPLLLDRVIRNLGENVNEKWEGDPEARASGIIVDTPSSFASGTSPGSSGNDHRHTLIKSCIDAFRINTILVVGHEKLNVEMARTYGSRLSVVKIPKSGGVVELDMGYRERVHRYQLHTYMYGQVIEPPLGVGTATLGGETMTDLVLSPSSVVLGFDDLSIYRIGEETMAPTSALPIGGTRILTEMQPLKIDPAQSGSGLLNAVVALLAPFNPDEAERYDEEILDLTVVGFLVITHLDMAQKKMTLLAPSQGSLVGRTAVVGSFEWQDT